MILDQSSVDISTLVDKINRQEIDLQPDFQRGQVWSDSKKRRLIDTILRGWYVPAIHIVVNDDLDKEEVLDGQQRLRAIMEFINNVFAIDGNIEPVDDSVRALDGLRYNELPDAVRSRFRRFTINTVRLREYKSAEPGELFFRLNQLTALTAAEQRNALIGEPRNEIRRLAERLEDHLSGRSIGFSNARMNYDDTLARLAIALETEKLQEKVTAASLEKRYRIGLGFDPSVLSSMEWACDTIIHFIDDNGSFAKLNRASLFSWLYFVIDHKEQIPSLFYREFSDFFGAFEAARTTHSFLSLVIENKDRTLYDRLSGTPAGQECIDIFNDRASSRVNDVSSVLLRDLSLNASLAIAVGFEVADFDPSTKNLIQQSIESLSQMPSDVADRSVAESSLAKKWEGRRAST